MIINFLDFDSFVWFVVLEYVQVAIQYNEFLLIHLFDSLSYLQVATSKIIYIINFFYSIRLILLSILFLLSRILLLLWLLLLLLLQASKKPIIPTRKVNMYFNRLVPTKLLKVEIHVGLPRWDGFFLLALSSYLLQCYTPYKITCLLK